MYGKRGECLCSLQPGIYTNQAADRWWFGLLGLEPLVLQPNLHTSKPPFWRVADYFFGTTTGPKNGTREWETLRGGGGRVPPAQGQRLGAPLPNGLVSTSNRAAFQNNTRPKESSATKFKKVWNKIDFGCPFGFFCERTHMEPTTRKRRTVLVLEPESPKTVL